jgi:hypothetical protein
MNSKTSSVSKLVAVWLIQPLCALAASYHSGPNEIGEQVYSTHSLRHMLPIVIIVGGLLSAWVLTKFRGKRSTAPEDSAESHHS